MMTIRTAIKFRLKAPTDVENFIIFELARKKLVQLTVPEEQLKEINVKKEKEKYYELKNRLKELCDELFIRRLKKASLDEIIAYLDVSKIEEDLEKFRKKIDESLVKVAAEIDYSKIEELSRLTADIFKKREELAKEFYPIACKINTALDALIKIADMKQYARRENAKYTFLEGWVLEDKISELNSVLSTIEKRHKVNISVEYEKKAEYLEEAPTRMVAPQALSPFASITRQMGTPAAYEIDPTPIVWFFWILMFGLMFPDFGQGIILILMGLFIMKKKEFFGFSGKKVGILLVWGGIIASISGLLLGEIFMVEVKPLLPGLHEGWVEEPEYILQLLKIAILFGMFQILVGLILGMFINIKRKEYLEAVFGVRGIAGILLFLGLIFFGAKFLGALIPRNIREAPWFLNLSIGMLALSIIMIMILPKLEKGLSFSDAFGELIEAALAFIANTFSYIRLAGFALVHLMLAVTVTKILVATVPLWIKGLMAVLLNFIALTIELLVVAIQSTRLVLYEFFTKFYHGVGKVFRPISIEI